MLTGSILVEFSQLRRSSVSKFPSHDTIWRLSIGNRTLPETEMSEEERRVDHIIKFFLLNTTRLRPRLTRPIHKIEAARWRGFVANAKPPDNEEADQCDSADNRKCC